jgi:arsenite methyltransferase
MSGFEPRPRHPALARHYEQVSADRQFKAGKTLVERLALRPGEHVLDVGSGRGLLAEYVAEIVGPVGFVTAIDPLPLRIDAGGHPPRGRADPRGSAKALVSGELGAS